MHATNFSVRAGIYFVLAGVQLDMHNDYDFTGFSYDVSERSLLLTWQRGSGKWVTLDQPGVVILEIREVASLEMRPRSAGVPFTEDDCLNDVSYLADEAWGRTAFQGAGEPPCLASADVDGDGAVKDTDAIFLLRFLFQGSGDTIPFPGIGECAEAPEGTCATSNCVRP